MIPDNKSQKTLLYLRDQLMMTHRGWEWPTSDKVTSKLGTKKDLCDANIINKSESPFTSLIVDAKKKNGTIRLCIDYRRLNNHTIKYAYVLPNIEEAFSALTGSKWWNQDVIVRTRLRKRINMTFWEFNRVPQGVTNAPSMFQPVMEKCIGSLNLKIVLVVLNDLSG